jgi:branched-chain amino acid transport system permease protein
MRISLQFRGFLYVIISFSFMLVTTSVLINWIDFTGGPFGIFGIPPVNLFGVSLKGYGPNLVIDLAFMAIVLVILWRLGASPFGLALRAIRENEQAAMASGLDVRRLRIAAFMIGSVIASLGGSLYAPLISFIEPTVFNVFFSFTLVTMVLVGGTGSLWGATFGAFALTFAPFAITFLPVPQSILGPIRQIMYGALLLATLRWRPQGVIPEKPWRKILPAMARKPDLAVAPVRSAAEPRS